MSMRYTGEGAHTAGTSGLADVQHAQEADQENRDAGAPGSGRTATCMLMDSMDVALLYPGAISAALSSSTEKVENQMHLKISNFCLWQ